MVVQPRAAALVEGKKESGEVFVPPLSSRKGPLEVNPQCYLAGAVASILRSLRRT
jgi:hypothetical protein